MFLSREPGGARVRYLPPCSPDLAPTGRSDRTGLLEAQETTSRRSRANSSFGTPKTVPGALITACETGAGQPELLEEKPGSVRSGLKRVILLNDKINSSVSASVG